MCVFVCVRWVHACMGVILNIAHCNLRGKYFVVIIPLNRKIFVFSSLNTGFGSVLLWLLLNNGYNHSNKVKGWGRGEYSSLTPIHFFGRKRI